MNEKPARKPKPANIGLRGAYQLCNMTAEDRLAVIAEGLPIIFESASSLRRAADLLTDHPRESATLRSHAEEEAAKILILVDVLRCPPKVIGGRIGRMIDWFYDHLARLIYAEAQHWQAWSLDELQGYANHERRTHYLEGMNSEYIMPNSTLFDREGILYADLIQNERDGPAWNAPTEFWSLKMQDEFPPSRLDHSGFNAAEALDAVGAFTPEGLRVLQAVWNAVDFDNAADWPLRQNLAGEMIDRLHDDGLQKAHVTEDHVRDLIRFWQGPMYRVDFSTIPVSLMELQGRRDREFYSRLI